MADTATLPPAEQASIEMPNGITLTGVGGDLDQLREQFEDRHEARTGKTIDATVSTDDQAPAAAASPESAPADDKPKPIRKRIGQLTFEREEAIRKADAAEARVKELEAKLTAPPIAAPAAAAAPVVTAPLEPPATRLKPTEAMVGTTYQTYSDFVEDLADWKAEQREAKLISTLDARTTTRIEADRASRTRADQVGQVFTSGRAAFPDFDAVLATADQIIVPASHQHAILSLPHPERIMYGLAKDHAALTALIAINDPVQVGVRLASFITREPVAPPASTAPAVRTTNAPAPPQPVGAGTRTAKLTLQELVDKGDLEGYQAARAAGQTD